jgi:hypothetical protein
VQIIKENPNSLTLYAKPQIWTSIILAITGIPSCLFMMSIGFLVPNLICIGVPLCVLAGLLYFTVIFTKERRYDFDLNSGMISIHIKYLFTNLFSRSLSFPLKIIKGVKISISDYNYDDDYDVFYNVKLVLTSTNRTIFLSSEPSRNLSIAKSLAEQIASFLQIPILENEKPKPNTIPYVFDWKQREMEVDEYEKILESDPQNPEIYFKIGLLTHGKKSIDYFQQAEDGFTATNNSLLAEESRVLKSLIKWKSWFVV